MTHPGYVRSNFTRDLPKLKLWAQLGRYIDVFNMFFLLYVIDKIGQFPHEVVDNMLRCIGRIAVLDSGIFSWGSRIVTKFVDTNALLKLLQHTAHLNPDFRRVMVRPRL